jgi:hypothetical protein
MSHTITVDGWNLHFDAGLSGLVTIVSPDGGSEVQVPFGVLAEFTGSAMLGHEIARMEAMTGMEYLARLKGTASLA